ncbi:MAG: DNA repair exonuclease [Acidilobaceae archaeon]
MRLLHLSDTHLGYRQYGLVEREDDFYDAFDEAMSIAMKERVEAVIHGGDFFHSSHPTPRAYREAARRLKELRGRGIKFFVAPGNHELPKGLMKGSPLKVLEEMELLHSPERYDMPSEFLLGELSILIFSARAAEGLFDQELLRSARGKVKVALAHLLLCDVSPEVIRGGKCEKGWWAERIPQEYAYVALGDLHYPWGRVIEGRHVVYPGSTEFTSISEYLQESNRYVVLLEVRGREVEVQRVRLERVRPWAQLRGSEEEVMRQISGLRGTGGKPPIVFVEVTSGTSLGRRRVEEALGLLQREGKVLTYRYEQRAPEQLRVRVRGEGGLSVEGVLRRLLKEERLVKAMLELLDRPEGAKQFLAELERDRALLLQLKKALEVKGR